MKLLTNFKMELSLSLWFRSRTFSHRWQSGGGQSSAFKYWLVLLLFSGSPVLFRNTTALQAGLEWYFSSGERGLFNNRAYWYKAKIVHPCQALNSYLKCSVIKSGEKLSMCLQFLSKIIYFIKIKMPCQMHTQLSLYCDML